MSNIFTGVPSVTVGSFGFSDLSNTVHQPDTVTSRVSSTRTSTTQQTAKLLSNDDAGPVVANLGAPVINSSNHMSHVVLYLDYEVWMDANMIPTSRQTLLDIHQIDQTLWSRNTAPQRPWFRSSKIMHTSTPLKNSQARLADVARHYPADRVGNVDWFYAVFKPAQTTKSTWVVFSKSQATYDKFVDDTLRKLRRNPNSTVHISMRIDESRFEQRPKWSQHDVENQEAIGPIIDKKKSTDSADSSSGADNGSATQAVVPQQITISFDSET
ncbi:hypothetical protein PSHT_01848 [Puccinia striiformis]|uniref:Uncharacterized protein n=1 Tax=Puccinia striiformis TaxID=27350 RepID=A0A2S4WJG7_9BASI|nr:hypothetical protein PSHT_01848 [Puccinia striiformis]